jgi:hypothetical protein
MNALLSTTRNFLVCCLFCLAIPAAYGDDWPITPIKLAVPAAAHGGVASAGPGHNCQPESFDPKTTPYHPAGPASAVVAAYQVEGGDATTSMTLNSRAKPDDAKTVLPEPLSLSRFIFTCAGGSSEALEFVKASKRYAIFTHVSQEKFTPDFSKLVLYNYAKPHHGGWQEMRRIFDIRVRRFVPLPMIRETAFLADVANDRVLTYGLAANGKPAMLAVWKMDGKLVQAYSAPLRAAANGAGTADAVGLLPNDPATLYHLTRSGNDECTLRLQNTEAADGRRAIKLAVPGAANDAAPLNARVQLDLAGLRLKGGAVKYRVSASGKGDDWSDWSDWKTAE